MFLNMLSVDAEEKLMRLGGNLINGDILYKLVLLATDSKEKAEEAYTVWIESRRGSGMKDDTPVSLDSIGIIGLVSSLGIGGPTAQFTGE